MRKYNKIALLGGDERMLSCARVLSDEVELAAWGFGTHPLPSYSVRVRDAADAIKNSVAIVLPTPASRDGVHIFAPLSDGAELSLRSLVELAPADALIIGGAFTPAFKSELDSAGLSYVDITEDGGFAEKNAIPTAEGALAIAISETPITLSGAECAVLGYGRCARPLARALYNLGAHVTVAARRSEVRCEAAEAGYRAVSTSDIDALSGADIIFNTVPARLFSEESAKKLKRGALIIDLASAPYCADARAIPDGVRYIRASALPGRYSPVSAGRIIGECVLGHLRQGGILP